MSEYVYKVIESSDDADDVIHFDTSTGSSDSFLDANKCFNDLCFKLLMTEGGKTLRLMENGRVKKESDHIQYIEDRVCFDHIC